MKRMIQVYQATTLLDVEMACVRLRRYGLRPHVEGDAVGIRGPATPITVWVMEQDAEKAIRILEKALLASRNNARTAPQGSK